MIYELLSKYWVGLKCLVLIISDKEQVFEDVNVQVRVQPGHTHLLKSTGPLKETDAYSRGFFSSDERHITLMTYTRP